MSHGVSLQPQGQNSALRLRIEQQLDLVEEALQSLLTLEDGFLEKVAQHLFMAGGKRVRPLLTLIASEFGDGPSEDIRKAAAVVELTHIATLYHDDVMDSAPTRRGAPSAHELWGNSVAILAGDLMFAKASNLVADLGPQAVKLQASTFERLCVGQLHETLGPRDGEDPVEHYLQVISDKTGSLIAASGVFGARWSGVDEEHVESIRVFCEHIGVAFQLADDVLDIMSDGDVSGKTPGTDLREGVPTLPVLYARQDAEQGDAAAQRVVELVDGDLSDDGDLRTAVLALRELPATGRAQETADKAGQDALQAIGDLPDGQAKDLLTELAHQLVHRSA